MKMSANQEKIKKVSVICAKAHLEDVYASLVLTNGARMEGIEANIFFTFFGLDALRKNKMDKLHTATVGNPGMEMPGGLPFPTFLGGVPGVEAGVSAMMRKEMDKLDIPPVSEFLEMITASGGKVYACKLAMDMFKLKEEDLYDDLDAVLTVGDFYEKAAGGQIIFT
jgi:peroxiredoxin family protein